MPFCFSEQRYGERQPRTFSLHENERSTDTRWFSLWLNLRWGYPTGEDDFGVGAHAAMCKRRRIQLFQGCSTAARSCSLDYATCSEYRKFRGPRVHVKGYGNTFNSDAVINWNGSKQTTTHMTGNQLTTTIPGSAIATPGTVAVTVTNPGHAAGGIYGTGGTASATSTPMNFTIN
jgi:hypothetical protein